MKAQPKALLVFAILLVFLANSCENRSQSNVNSGSTDLITVGVFDKNGDNPFCITDALEALRIDAGISARVVSAADIMSGAADDIDVFLFPGGGGRSETHSLGQLGQQKIINLVTTGGKGVVGICAGAYILTHTPNYPSLGLSGAQAIDLENDHRGHGLAQFKLTDEGKKIFPELANLDTCYSQYYEGPVLIPDKGSPFDFNELATMLSDVHTVPGTPANMTNNRPFIIVTQAGKGKTASVVGHPENTPGMRWIVPRLVRLVADRPLVEYGQNVVRPDIYNQEILFTPQLLEKQDVAYYNLVGTTEQKLQAMRDLVAMAAWSAKKWVPPMVRDSSFDVRLLAAQLTVYLERTDAIDDLKAAVQTETNSRNKQLLKKQLELLQQIVGQ